MLKFKRELLTTCLIIFIGITLVNMNQWIKIAAGVLGGLTIIASLGGFKGNNKKNNNSRQSIEVEELPDDILDGNNMPRVNKPDRFRRESEQNVRNLQEGLSKASNVITNLSIIANSIVRMFFEDPRVQLSPTTYIY